MENIPMNLTNVSLTSATHKLNSWVIWTTYKKNLSNIFLTIKINWNLLPNEIWLKIIRAVLQQHVFKANHIWFAFATLNLVNKRFKELNRKCKDNLLRIYCNPELIIPKPKSGKHIFGIQSLIQKFVFLVALWES